MTEFLLNWLLNVPAFAVPFALAALGLILSERAGILNLGAEGFMLAGALAGIGLMINGASPVTALGGAVLAGSAMGLFFAFLTASLRINHVIAGLALVFFADALTRYIASDAGWTNKAVHGLEPVFLGQDILVWATPFLCLGCAFLLNRTRFGLSLRAVGENPAAADAAGIDVTTIRILALVLGSALIGLAGGYLTVAVSKIWTGSVVGGRGWICHRPGHFRPLASLARLAGGHSVRLYRGADPPHCGDRRRCSALLPADDALCGHAGSHDLDRDPKIRERRTTSSPWTAPHPGRPHLMPFPKPQTREYST